jgi:hypothetical protein
MTNLQLLDFVSRVSVWINNEVDSVSNTTVSWINNKGEFYLDLETNHFQFVDSKLDSKTYFAILALCASVDVTTGDYFNEKKK